MPSTRFIINTDGWATVCERAVLADSPWLRLRGLLGRDALPSGEGLLLDPCSSIHTSFMRFPIDVVLLDSDLRVLRIAEALRPWRTAGHRHAKMVLELTAGEAARRGVELGDQLLLLPQDPAASPTGETAGAGPAPRRSRLRRAREPRTGDHPSVEMSVLVASGDRRFRTVASTLLERRGCRVEVLDDPLAVARRTVDAEPDVVVLDTDRSPGEPVLAAAGLGATSPRTGVVLVGDGTRGSFGQPFVTDKWGRFDELFAAIDDAYWHRGGRKASG